MPLSASTYASAGNRRPLWVMIWCLVLGTALGGDSTWSRNGSPSAEGWFRYQARLLKAGTAQNGTFDLRFSVWDAPRGGQPLWMVDLSGIRIDHGVLRARLPLSGTLVSAPGNHWRWLEVGIRPTAEEDAKGHAEPPHEVFRPRQLLLPGPP